MVPSWISENLGLYSFIYTLSPALLIRKGDHLWARLPWVWAMCSFGPGRAYERKRVVNLATMRMSNSVFVNLKSPAYLEHGVRTIDNHKDCVLKGSSFFFQDYSLISIEKTLWTFPHPPPSLNCQCCFHTFELQWLREQNRVWEPEKYHRENSNSILGEISIPFLFILSSDKSPQTWNATRTESSELGRTIQCPSMPTLPLPRPCPD